MATSQAILSLRMRLGDEMGIESAMAVVSTSAPTGEQKAGIYVTRESFTFPAASVVLTVLLNFLSVPFKGANTSFWWALGTACALGVLIYAKSLTSQMSRSEKWISAAFAFLNSLLLAASALGLNSLAASDPAKF
ncbi:hypothetical protein [Streptomyces sp. SP18BB07]|uniref:hypothetical protein n=1 Tax=Streptomyces sp. SP18BB07 TaxID=3002522 RepID=UPI002E760476|nr:hypothetical protein [Streptomyces sp. SP18BB07]MEE1763026.1 hypothetical protein [Streptomyces sp. SP18BB07]